MGSSICEEIELNKAQWSALFDHYLFFEAYKNYLQIDIIAADVDDLLAWKGWVESRLRQLTLKIERDTYGMLQCHPYPNEYVDISKPCPHCAFFIYVEQLMSLSNMSTCTCFGNWGWIFMFLMFVGSKFLVMYFQMGINDAEGCRSHSAEKQLKRKRDSEMVNSKTDKPEKRASISPLRPWSVSPESCTSRSSATSRASCSGEVKLEPLVAGDADSNPEVRPSTVVDYSETGYTKRHLALAENDKSALGSNICRLGIRILEVVKIVRAGSLQGNVCAADLDSHLENRCLNGSRLFENSVAETLEPTTALGMAAESQNRASSESMQKPVMRHVESEINSIKFGSQVVL
ncbi:unnamed protein product [Camellia sinensis]